jgi:hypothetical protein
MKARCPLFVARLTKALTNSPYCFYCNQTERKHDPKNGVRCI